MGIPRLFKYLNERYPGLIQTIEANQLPEYDYLYIDLNFLLHKAATKNGLLPLEIADENFLSECRIFERVLRQIETLHRIIPSKVLFLAIDGVAPRAKWATQRERRLQACEKNDESKVQFDKNSISPGTIFMRNFEKILLEFIGEKMKQHKNWQNCDIYISGSNVPGEGSIKIIDFIRHLKHSKDYNPNQTHCIYSGDNDYLMLGIATHEIYISFIQEPKWPTNSLVGLCVYDVKHKFTVIHFELLRQYLRMEFIECQNEMSFQFCMDRIADDWVVLMTLIGNDYLPGLPKFDLDNDIISIIYDAYKEILKTSNGYINECSMLNVRRFARLLQILKPKDFDIYCNNVDHLMVNINSQMAAVDLNDSAAAAASDESAINVNFSDFLEMKDQYYTEKFQNSNLPDFEGMSVNYVKTVQWILFYYFRGENSWLYRYPYKCAPFVSDFTSTQNSTFTLDMDKPVKVFTHLLAILPKHSAHLMPSSYQKYITDEVNDDMNDLLQKANYAEQQLNVVDVDRNRLKPMLKLQYVKKDIDCVKITEIIMEKRYNASITEKYLDRPLNWQEFNFKFTTLNLHDFTSHLVLSDLKKTPRMMLKLDAKPLKDLDSVAKEWMNQIVYINWPHFAVAKVKQIVCATKKFDGDEFKMTENSENFDECVRTLNLRNAGVGIDVGNIEMIAFVHPLKYMEYKDAENINYFEYVEQWDETLKVVPIQTLSHRFMTNPTPDKKPVKEALQIKDVFLFGGRSEYYGEMATIVDDQSLETNGRVNILAYKHPDPNFANAMNLHYKSKQNSINEFKQPSSAASLLGISEKVFARITGSVLVNLDKMVQGRKINIGLQLKSRNSSQASVSVLHEYVKNVNNRFIYSQQTIDLVQQYMTKFPRVIEVLSTPLDDEISVSDFDENNNANGMDYITDIRQWIQSLPHYKEMLKPVDQMKLSDSAIEDVKRAVFHTHAMNPKMFKLKMRWQNLYIPELNNVFVVPCPEAIYKLLDRVIVVRSGYPVPVGATGTVIGIEPKKGYACGIDITNHELYALEILMDAPYRIEIKSHEFKCHQIFRIGCTNMLINLSHGRTIESNTN